jgi:hypothetical protein
MVQVQYRIMVCADLLRAAAHEYPYVIFHELVDREITRVVEWFDEERLGIARARDSLELAGTGLPEHLDPDPLPPSADFHSVVAEISEEEFERVWKLAVKRLEMKLGVKIPA